MESEKMDTRHLQSYVDVRDVFVVVSGCFCVACAKSKCEACKEEMESQKELAGLTDAGFEADSAVFWNDSFECFLVRLWSRLKRLKGHILLFLMGVQVHKPENF